MELGILCSIIAFFLVTYACSKLMISNRKTNLYETIATNIISTFLIGVLSPLFASVPDIAYYVNKNIPKIEKGIENAINNIHTDKIFDKKEHQNINSYDTINGEIQLDEFPFFKYTSSLWGVTEEMEDNEGQEEIPTPLPTFDFKNSTYIRVTSRAVKVRISPNATSKKVGILYFGEIVISLCETMGEDGRMWHKISSEEIQGYIPSKYTKILNFDKEKYIQVKPGTITLNVREKPNTKCTILTQISEDYAYRVLKIVKKKNQIIWYKIEVDKDIKGYVAADFVNVIG